MGEEHLEAEGLSEPVPRAETTPQLIGDMARETVALIKAEVELAKAELKRDLRTELGVFARFAIAAVAAFCGLNMLFVAAAMALGTAMAEWGAALIVAFVLLAAAAAVAAWGWSKRVKSPLDLTKTTVKEDLRWLKQRTA